MQSDNVFKLKTGEEQIEASLLSTALICTEKRKILMEGKRQALG